MPETKLGRIAMMPRGDYGGSEVYQRLDVVKYGGSAWLCLQDNLQGSVPQDGANWMLLADKMRYEDLTAEQKTELAQGAQDAADSAAAYAAAMATALEAVAGSDDPGAAVAAQLALNAGKIEQTEGDVDDLALKVSDISHELYDGDEEAVVFGDSLTSYTMKVKDSEVSVVGSLKKNGKEVLTEDDLSGTSSSSIEQITTETYNGNNNSVIFAADDYDKSNPEQSKISAEINNDGIKAKDVSIENVSLKSKLSYGGYSVDMVKDGFVFKTDGHYSGVMSAFNMSGFVRVFEGQKVNVKCSIYGNAAICGYFVDNIDSYVCTLATGGSGVTNAQTYSFIVPNGVNYIVISNVKAKCADVKIEADFNISMNIILEELKKYCANKFDLEMFTDFSFDKLFARDLSADFISLSPNFNIPNDNDRFYLSTDIYNAKFRNNLSNENVMIAFAPYLYYMMEKVGTFVLYDKDNSNKPFIFDKSGNKRYLSFES